MGVSFTNLECHSQAVGHRNETAFHKMWDDTHILLVIGMRLPFIEMCNVTNRLLVIGKDVMRPPFHKMCNASLPVGYSKRCNNDETAIHKIFNVAHILPVIH
jgi:hypothetical protein